MLPKIPQFCFALEYSEQEDTSEISLRYGGEKLDPLDEMDSLSKKIVEHNAADISYQYENGENRIRILVK